jgi:hypothetical protein
VAFCPLCPRVSIGLAVSVVVNFTRSAVRNCNRERVLRTARWISEGRVLDAVNRQQLPPAGDHATGEGFSIEERRDAGSKLAEHFRAICLGIVLLHARKVIGGEKGVHLRGRGLPDQCWRIVAAVVLAVQVVERAALAVWR